MLRILLPTDFSPPASNAFRYATKLATLINGRIDLVHVHLPEMLGGSMLSLKDIKDTERGVRNRFLERRGVRPRLFRGTTPACPPDPRSGQSVV